MSTETPLCDGSSYLVSADQAARLLGVLRSDLSHIVWLKNVPTLRIGSGWYVRRGDLFAAVDELFAECGELMARLASVDPQDFVRLYDEKFPADAWGEKAIRRRVMEAVFESDYRDAVWMVNFRGSTALSGREAARAAEVMRDLGHLTEGVVGEACGACG